jgi:hypothetical protein
MVINRSPAATESVETVFEALSNGRRRKILTYFSGRDDTASLDALTHHIATERQEDPVSVRISLDHVHLPKLDEMNVLNYDRETETVQRRRVAEQAATVLETARTVAESEETTE